MASPRARLTVYLVLLHLLFAALLAPLWWRERAWLLAVEAGCLLSLALGLRLVGGALRPLALVGESAERLAAHDLNTRFRPVGQPEVDALVSVYNRMADALGEERRRVVEQRHLLDDILRVSPSGIAILDLDGRRARLNPAAARLLEAEPGEVAVDALATPLARAALGVARGESRVVPAPDGRRVRVQRGTFLDRGFERSFVLLEELTEELRQGERRAYEKLIRTMSHEVNNTVGAVGSLLSSCLSYGAQLQPDDRQDFERGLGVAIDRSTQLGVFMRGLADVVRLPRPHPVRLDVADLAASVVTLLGPAASAEQVDLRLDAPAGPVVVEADRALLEQALLNVVKNGVEAAGRGGCVEVRVRAAPARLEVEDSGPGLSDDAREQIFTPFFTTREHGQGLGLTLVQEILAAHGFRFALDAPAGGPTVFRVALER